MSNDSSRNVASTKSLLGPLLKDVPLVKYSLLATNLVPYQPTELTAADLLFNKYQHLENIGFDESQLRFYFYTDVARLMIGYIDPRYLGIGDYLSIYEKLGVDQCISELLREKRGVVSISLINEGFLFEVGLLWGKYPIFKATEEKLSQLFDKYVF